jgi:hypothetical protein
VQQAAGQAALPEWLEHLLPFIPLNRQQSKIFKVKSDPLAE